MENKRIASFTSMLVCFVLACFTGYLAYAVGLDMLHTNSGAEAFVLIVTIPLVIFLYSIALAFILSTIITGIRATGSDIMALRVISIVILILTGIAFIFLLFAFLGAIGVL